jgi:hypothetical protein
MKLRKRSLLIIIIILSILVIAGGSYFWWINSPNYGLRVTNVGLSYDGWHHARITGVLTNKSNREFSDITIEFAIYHSPTNQIGVQTIHIDNLQPHKTYRFDEVLDQDLFDRGASSCEVISITTE